MRLLAILCVGATLAGVASAQAQVIGGESTYEDNFVHIPPPDETKTPDDKARPAGRSDVTPRGGGAGRPGSD